MMRVDAHAHLLGDHADSAALLDDLDIKVVNVCVARDTTGEWRHQVQRYKALADARPDRFAWMTAFDTPRFGDPNYADRVIEGLDRDFAAGAVACKIWKNIGMEVRSPDGRFFMMDDPLFEPIYAYLVRAARPLVVHIAEPLAAWQPLDPDNPHYGYYSTRPEWHFHGRTDVPTHAEIIASRDNVIERHPTLRVIGAHLGSLEYDVNDVATRLRRFPNFAVDTSARILDLARQDHATVREFFQGFPDRILFGTDIVSRQAHSELSDDERRQTIDALRERYLAELAYFSSSGDVDIRDRTVKGLGLGARVLEKLFRTSAGAILGF